MFPYFENLVNPLADVLVQQPPSGTRAFFLHYRWSIRWLLLMTVVMSSIASISELMLYVYLGRIVDWVEYNGARKIFPNPRECPVSDGFCCGYLRPASLFVARCLITLTLTPGLSRVVSPVVFCRSSESGWHVCPIKTTLWRYMSIRNITHWRVLSLPLHGRLQ